MRANPLVVQDMKMNVQKSVFRVLQSTSFSEEVLSATTARRNPASAHDIRIHRNIIILSSCNYPFSALVMVFVLCWQACREALLNRSNELDEARNFSFHKASAVYDLLTIALVRHSQFQLLSQVVSQEFNSTQEAKILRHFPSCF